MTNGEKYKGAKERHAAFCKWCDNHINGCNDCQLKGDSQKTYMCSFAWLDLEAEAENPLPCPFCGGICSIITAHPCEVSVIHCDKCGYCTPQYDNKDAAIAAHNRVARAVLDRRANDANA